MRVLPLAALSIAPVVGSCGTPQADLTEAQRRVITTSVDSAMRSFEAAERARDADRMLAHFVSGPEFRLYNDGQRVDYAAMAAQLHTGLGGLKSVEGGFEGIEVTVLSPGAALASATFRETATDTAGAIVRTHGPVTLVWVRRGTEWKIVYGQADHYPDSTP
jgi:ketosteroid isomerase-like protein